MTRLAPTLALFCFLAGGHVSGQVARDAGAEPACRCMERTLESYYQEADEVLVARLVGWEDQAADLRLRMVAAERPWKTADGRTAALEIGETLEVLTASSTAACGVPTVTGATYVVFGHADPGAGGTLRVDTCSGTRIYTTETGASPQGFTDVPGRFVFSRLDALGGMDVLREVAARLPDEGDPGNTTLVGLLDLEAPAHGGRVPVRDVPDPGTPVTTFVDSYEDVESREVGYEVGSAVVFARLDGWYRIRLADGAYGWVAAEDAGTWFPYAELPVRRLTYLTGSWSGYVWPEPGAGIPWRSNRKGTEPRDEYDAEVVESRIVGGTVWFRLNVLTGNWCDGGDTVAGSGWVPAYGADGEPTVWYYSRGC